MGKPWKWYVDVIECEDGWYYTGITWNVSIRVEQHRTGVGSQFIKKHRFQAVKYIEEFSNLLEARTREVQIKDFSRKKKEKLWSK